MAKRIKPVEIQCSRCSGSGKVQLAFVHAETLEAVRKHGSKGASIERLASVCDCAYTTMSQRLARLEALGLISLDRMSGRNMLAVIKEQPC